MGFFDGAGGAVLGAVGSIAGSIYAADQSKKSAREQMAFQERMSSSAHQREVADLRAAGLNPILSATGGPGASSPGGAGYEVDPDIGSKAVSSAKDVAVAKQQMSLLKAQEEQSASASDVNRAQAAKTRKETQILSPKAYLFDKVLEGLQSVPNQFRKALDFGDQQKKDYDNFGKTPMKGRP